MNCPYIYIYFKLNLAYCVMNTKNAVMKISLKQTVHSESIYSKQLINLDTF